MRSSSTRWTAPTSEGAREDGDGTAGDAGAPAGRGHRAAAVALALVLDLLAVLVFVGVGRSAHAEHDTTAGVAHTAWPFASALLTGWVVAAIWRAPRSLRRGAVVWAVTVALGQVWRVVSGQGTAASFVVVSAVVLGVLLLGWRGLAALARRGRARRGRQLTGTGPSR